jgi:GT2 family glycosyltransferase
MNRFQTLLSISTCAATTRGAEIDAHDTVFRHNTPTKGFEKYVGRKSRVVIVKSNYKNGGGGAGSAQGSGATPSLAYMVLKNVDQIPKNLKVEGKAGGCREKAALDRR